MANLSIVSRPETSRGFTSCIVSIGVSRRIRLNAHIDHGPSHAKSRRVWRLKNSGTRIGHKYQQRPHPQRDWPLAFRAVLGGILLRESQRNLHLGDYVVHYMMSETIT